MSVFEQQMMKSETVFEKEWVSANGTSPHTHSQVDQHQCSSEITLFDRDWLNAQLVDSLAEHQRDWIGSLQPDWQLELYNLNLIGIKDDKGSLKHACLSVTDLVFLIRKVRYEPLTIFHQQHWGYTCCLQIAGLGRVRLVACFNNPQCFGHYAAFVTNRLDWSPRHIIAHWIQHRPVSDLYAKNPSFKFHPQDSLQSA